MNIESQHVQNNESEMREPSLPPQPKSNSMLTLVMTMVCVCAGLGIGLAVMLWMPRDDNPKPHYGKKAKTNTSFLSWLTGDDGKKKNKKSNRIGPFHSVFNPEFEMPDPIEYKSPFESTPIIDF